MNKTSEVGHPKPGLKIKAICKFCTSETREEVTLITVDEDDISYRFEDGAELSYDWDVEEWKEIGKAY